MSLEERIEEIVDDKFNQIDKYGAVLVLIETEKAKAIKKILKAVRLSKQSTCGCENAFGYYTKECNLLPHGYNQAVDDLNAKIDNELTALEGITKCEEAIGELRFLLHILNMRKRKDKEE